MRFKIALFVYVHAAFTIFVSHAGYDHIVEEVLVRMNVLEAMHKTCDVKRDTKIREGVALLRSGINVSLRKLCKNGDSSIEAAMNKYSTTGPSVCKTGEAPSLTPAGEEKAKVIAEHLCSTKHIPSHMFDEFVWYEQTGGSSSQYNVDSVQEPDASSEETLESSESLDNSSTSKVFELSQFEFFCIGLVCGTLLSHYIFMLRNNVQPSVIGKSVRRPEL